MKFTQMTCCKVVFQGESPDFPAARLGGTQLLTYGELLPAGTEKAILVLAPQLHRAPRHEVRNLGQQEKAMN